LENSVLPNLPFPTLPFHLEEWKTKLIFTPVDLRRRFWSAVFARLRCYLVIHHNTDDPADEFPFANPCRMARIEFFLTG